jgi:hypothetical protein
MIMTTRFHVLVYVSVPVADVSSTTLALNQILKAFLTDSPTDNQMEFGWMASSNVRTTIITILANFIIHAFLLGCYAENCGGGGDEYREQT